MKETFSFNDSIATSLLGFLTLSAYGHDGIDLMRLIALMKELEVGKHMAIPVADPISNSRTDYLCLVTFVDRTIDIQVMTPIGEPVHFSSNNPMPANSLEDLSSFWDDHGLQITVTHRSSPLSVECQSLG